MSGTIGSVATSPVRTFSAPLMPSAQPLEGVKDGYDGGGASHLPEYWAPNLNGKGSQAVQGLLGQALTAHPIGDVSQLQGLPSGTWIVAAQKLDDGFVKFDLHQTNGAVRLFDGRVGSQSVPYAEFNTSQNYNAITPDGMQFSGGRPALAANAPFDLENPTDATRIAVVDPTVAEALVQHTGKTVGNFGFVNPEEHPLPTFGSHLHNALNDVATIGHTLHDVATFPEQVQQMGEDILTNG